jgi:hypothetical protein
MQSLLTSYTVYFNLRHSRHGHLFDGRFKAKLVEGDEYLLTLSRYVHLNPVRVGGLKEQDAATRIKALRSYYWSSYLQYIGRRKRLEFLTTEPTLAMCGGAKRYRGFVEEGVRTVDEEIAAALHTYPLSIGGDQFRDMVQERYAALAGKTASVADVAFGRQLSRLPADIVLDAVCEVLSCSIGQVSVRHKGTPLRPFAAHYLSRYAGLSRREISDILGVQSGQAVTLQIRKYRELVSENRRMRNLAKRCEHALETIRSQQPEAT